MPMASAHEVTAMSTNGRKSTGVRWTNRSIPMASENTKLAPTLANTSSQARSIGENVPISMVSQRDGGAIVPVQ